ncbi:MAG TPA: thioredoxin family protein [Planctomycetaceae bacterium]|nr:thioredoxin family protein [Planctomycetaceae bacterium]
MKRLLIVSLCVLVSLWNTTNRAQAEIPLVSFLVTANEKAEYGRIYPIVNYLNRYDNELQVEFALGSKQGVSVTIRLRSDVKVMPYAEIIKAIEARNSSAQLAFSSENLDRLTQELKEAGAADVTIEKVELFPSTPFTVEEFEKLRKQQKLVIVVCRADWNILSLKMDKEIFENTEVIRAVKQSKATIMVIDWTERATESVDVFIKKHNLSVPNFLVFQPSKDSPKSLEGPLTAKEFLEVIGVND